MSDQRPSLSAASCADDYDPNSMPVDAARALIHRYLNPVAGIEKVAIRQSLERVLAEDVISTVNVPSATNSAMDGYAVRGGDLPAEGEAELKVIGASLAGHPYAGPLSAFQAVRIMTGAKMPDGADTVVMQEHVRSEGDRIIIDARHRPGQNVRQAGEDLAVGQVVFAAGTRVRAAELGMLASLGLGEVAVFRKLRVAIFSTGDELRPVGSALAAGEIYDSNRYTLYGLLTRLNVDILDLGAIPDDPAAIRAALESAAAMADVVITSGGASVGEADYIKDVLAELGEVVFWKLAMKPGRPLAYGRVGKAHFFGLPGNPVAVMVTFLQFVRPALQTLMGQPGRPEAPTFKAVCETPLKKAPGRTEFQRGVLARTAAGEWTVRAIGNQSSGVLRSMSEANCFIVLPQDQGPVAPGQTVEVQPFDGIL